MRTKLVSTLAVLAVVATACGGSDGAGGQQGEVADLFIELASDEDLEIDRGCVEEAAAGLSDDDAAMILEAGTEGTPDISPEADAIGTEMLSCVDAGSYIDSIVSQFEDDDSVDADCLRTELEGLTSPDEMQAGLIDAALNCSS